MSKNRPLFRCVIALGLACASLLGSTVPRSRAAPADGPVTWYPVPAMPPPPAPADILLPASRNYNELAGLPVRKLFNNTVRDPHILTAPDGYYYMVATAFSDTLPAPLKSSPDSNAWWYNDGIPLWRSKDLVRWETMGYVWTLEKDATWAREKKLSPHTARPDGGKLRAVWAPEIHYVKGNYWIPYCMNYDGTGLLKSTTGRPEGPYIDVKPEGTISDGIDASMFEDSDGTVYWLDTGYRIARMKPDLSDLAEPIRRMEFNPPPPWGEGINLNKVNGIYVWSNASNPETSYQGRKFRTYDCFSATAKSPYGPYNDRYRAIPFAGHQDFFQDRQGQWYSMYFHANVYLNMGLTPGIVAVNFDKDAHVSLKRAYPMPQWRVASAAPASDWTADDFDDAGWKEAPGGFGDPVLKEAGPVVDIGTEWTAGERWLRRRFDLADLPSGPALYLRAGGPVQISINGKQVYASNEAQEEYQTFALENAPLRSGANTMAVHAQPGTGPAYLDVGLIDRKERLLVPTAQEKSTDWRYTINQPGRDWMKPGFPETGWETGKAGFGGAGLPRTVPGTPWTSADIWLRREFDLADAHVGSVVVRVYHDEDVEVFVNGVLAASAPGFNQKYDELPMSPQAVAALRAGKNLVAVHCHQTTGGQYIDVGIADVKK